MANAEHKPSPVNVQDPVGKTVGKRRVRDPVAYGMKLQRAAGTLQRALRVPTGPKGVFRFRTFEEADAWLLKIQTRPKT